MAAALLLGPAVAFGQNAAAPAPAPPSPAEAKTPPAAPAPAAHPETAARPAPAEPAAAPVARPFDAKAEGEALTKLQNQLATVTTDKQLADIAGKAAVIQSDAARAYVAPQAELAEIAEGLRQATAVKARRSDTVAATRNRLLARQAALIGEQAAARTVLTQAGAVYNDIAERRRAGFTGRVLERTASPLTPDFWTSLAAATGGDLAHLNWMVTEVVRGVLSAPQPRGVGGLLAGVVVAVLLAWPARRLLDHLGWRRARELGRGGAAHTLAVAWRVIVDVVTPTLAAEAVRLGARWGGLLAPPADQLAQAAVGAVAWMATILALGRALGAGGDPAERLLNIGDSQASRARVALWVIAVVTAGGFLLQRLNYIIGASVAATIAANCVIAISYAGAAALILISFGRDEPEAAAAPAGDPAERTVAPAWTIISLALAAAVVATLGAVLFGYTTLAVLIAGQIFWLALIASVTFLALRLVDDLIGSMFKEHGRTLQTLHRLFGLPTSTIAQLGLLISAGLQLVIILMAVVLALTPFGQSGQLLVSHLQGLAGELRIGKVTLSPAGLAAGLGTFVLGVALVHVARTWVERRYLPVTRWDPGVRNSVTTGVSYVGMFIAVLSALAVAGVGLTQLALVASALSVGIGFGLQQIVQNFVAGVILLIERPVKIGDWINVGGVEGDVLDIRVRATDIRSLDGATVIVPNSSLITTNVVNKTAARSRTRLQLQVAVTKAADVPLAREAILEIARARDDVRNDPAPEVYVDALTAGGGATLIAWVHLADPRAAVRTRSELYLALLEDFQKRGIAL